MHAIKHLLIPPKESVILRHASGNTSYTTRYFEILRGTTSGTARDHEVLRVVLRDTTICYKVLRVVLRATTRYCKTLQKVLQSANSLATGYCDIPWYYKNDEVIQDSIIGCAWLNN